jgi:hypothetical protein
MLNVLLLPLLLLLLLLPAAHPAVAVQAKQRSIHAVLGPQLLQLRPGHVAVVVPVLLLAARS